MAARGTRRPRRQRRSTPMWLRTVHVNQYARWRYERWESVRQHWRSPPGTQLTFDF
ncbi:TPA: hypothetical protein L5695_002766 [Pseudomonas aeruginosa]|nr:hypothetical protein [Pseudomonas aeruginosa]